MLIMHCCAFIYASLKYINAMDLIVYDYYIVHY